MTEPSCEQVGSPCCSQQPSDPPTQAVRFDLAYDGTDFCGWQLQPNLRTGEGVLRAALETILGTPVRLRCAGRTDAGVHARHQVVVFHTTRTLSPLQLQRAANSLLPEDLQVWGSQSVTTEFDPRRANSRTYLYRIVNGPVPDPLRRRFVYHIYPTLNIEAMQHAAQLFVGTHELDAFRSLHCDATTTQREILSAWVRVVPDSEIQFEITAWAFLRHTVRIMVGTLVEIGLEKRPVEDIARLLACKDRSQAGQTAPARGLTLMHIEYD